MRISISSIVVLSACLAAGCDHPRSSNTDPVDSNHTIGATATDNDSSKLPKAAEQNAEASSPNADASASWREVTLPAGTVLPIVLDTAVGSDISREDSTVAAHVAEAVSVHGSPAVPANSSVTGVVTDATPAGQVKGRSHVSVRFTTLAPRGSDEQYPIATAAIGRTGRSEKKKDAVKIGAPAAGGAVVGGIVGGKKGAVIGGAIGGGAGAAVVMTDRGEEVRLGKGATLSVRLEQPVTIRVRS